MNDELHMLKYIVRGDVCGAGPLFPDWLASTCLALHVCVHMSHRKHVLYRIASVGPCSSLIMCST